MNSEASSDRSQLIQAYELHHVLRALLYRIQHETPTKDTSRSDLLYAENLLTKAQSVLMAIESNPETNSDRLRLAHGTLRRAYQYLTGSYGEQDTTTSELARGS